MENWGAEPGMLETWHVNTRDAGDLGCKAPRMLEVDMES